MITESVRVPQEDLRKLLAASSGDAALLYLFIHSGNQPEKAGL